MRATGLILLAAWACAREKTERSDDTAASSDTGVAWSALPSVCEAATDLLADPLTLEGEVRVTQSAGGGFMEAVDVEVRGGFAAAVGMGRLLLFDVSDPAAPEKLYGPAETSAGKLHRVEWLGDGLLATSQRDEGVQIWDVSDPGAPVELAEIAGPGLEGLAWDGALLWVTVRDEGVRGYDLSDPGAPALVASAAGLSAPWELAASGDGWLYAADNTLGLVPIDARDPLAPVVGAPVLLDGPALHPRFADGRIYVSMGGAGVAILDATTRATPTVVEVVQTGGSAVMSDVVDGRLWIADHEGLAVFDLSTSPATPIQREQTEQFALAVDAEGDRAFVGDWNLFEIWALDPDVLAPALDVPSHELRVRDGGAETTITNLGGATLSLLGATAGDAVVEADAAVIEPGASATLRLRGATVGDTLCLSTDDPDEPLYSFTLVDDGEPPVGEPAPDFALSGLDGQTHRLSEQLGHPVLLVYFATW